MSLYEVLKFLHVLLVIVAVGFNASYGIWLGRAANEPEHELHVVRGIKVLDDRFANPAYALILVTGIGMLIAGGISPTTFWIASSLTLYVITALTAILVYSPVLRRQIALLEGGRQSTAEYDAASKKGRAVGIFLAVLVIVIVFMMVTKPTL